MSEVHWALRQNMLVAVRNALQFGLDHGMEFTEGDYYAIAQAQGVNLTRVTSDLETGAITDCSERAANAASGAMSDVRNRTSGGIGGILDTNTGIGSIDSGDVENASEAAASCAPGE
jgi:hypothetical protein